MSTLNLITEFATTAAAAGGDGLTGWVNEKSAEAMTSIRLVSYVVAVALFLMRSAKGGWAVSTMLINGFLAGLLLFIVHNVTDVEDRVKDEFDTTASVEPVSAHSATTSQS